MPKRPLKPCGKVGCRELTEGRYCTQHQQDVARKYEQERGSAAQRGYDVRWRKARLVYLAKHPLCVHCLNDGRATVATVVDHIVPHKGNQMLFWDGENNWQSLCEHHHNLKTATVDGGFGR